MRFLSLAYRVLSNFLLLALVYYSLNFMEKYPQRAVLAILVLVYAATRATSCFCASLHTPCAASAHLKTVPSLHAPELSVIFHAPNCISYVARPWRVSTGTPALSSNTASPDFTENEDAVASSVRPPKSWTRPDAATRGGAHCCTAWSRAGTSRGARHWATASAP